MEIDLTSALHPRHDLGLKGEAAAPEEVKLGQILARLRAERGWTLQEAASHSGVSFSALSKIERNELSPTVNTLSKIAKGMGLSLAQLLEDSAPPPVMGRRAIMRSSDGQTVPTGTCDNLIMATEISNRKMTPIRTRVRARELSAYSEWATYNAEIFLTVLSGQVAIHSRNYAPVSLAKGDSIYYDASSGHLWLSEGEEDAVVLWLYAE